jgi:hypothetical protein
MSRAGKAKGRTGQQEVRDKLLETFPEFEPGEDIQLSPAARKTMPITIEVKRRKSGFKTAYGYIDQASNHAKGEPVVFYRSDRQPWIVMISIDHYMELLRNWKK